MKKRRRRKSWFRVRNYSHFDPAVNKEQRGSLISCIKNPEWVERHRFYPFIKRIKVTKKFKRDEHGKLVYKDRPICYAAHVDSHIYAYYARKLGNAYEDHIKGNQFAQCVVAYRTFTPPKSNIHFAEEVFSFIRAHAPCVALNFDIEGFFDNLNHEQIKQAWRSILPEGDCKGLIEGQLPPDQYKVFRSITRFAFVKEKRLRQLFPGFFKLSREERKGKQICTLEEFRRLVRGSDYVAVNKGGKGIPQGSPISALLSNLYMLPFDRAIYEIVSRCDGLYCRYSDDLIVICKPEHASNIKQLIEDEIDKLALTIQEAKTEKVLFYYDESDNLQYERLEPEKGKRRPLQYLGFEFDGQHITLRQRTLSRYYGRMRRAVKRTSEQAQKTPAKRTSGAIVRRRKLHQRFTRHGRGNFLSYVRRAEKIMKDSSIDNQVEGHKHKLDEQISRAEKKMRKNP